MNTKKKYLRPKRLWSLLGCFFLSSYGGGSSLLLSEVIVSNEKVKRIQKKLWPKKRRCVVSLGPFFVPLFIWCGSASSLVAAGPSLLYLKINVSNEKRRITLKKHTYPKRRRQRLLGRYCVFLSNWAVCCCCCRRWWHVFSALFVTVVCLLVVVVIRQWIVIPSSRAHNLFLKKISRLKQIGNFF